MDGKTLRAAMSYPGYPAPLSLARYNELAPAVNQALREAKCTTPARVSMFLAQIGAESGSLRWMEELADGSAYNGRRDLGNTQPGDGPRFKGRGPIQVTGRHNYTRLSQWAYKHGYVPGASYFVKNPSALSKLKYAFLGAVWYWTVARNMNKYADARDINGATYAVNGGYNNLSGRKQRWRKCLSLGAAMSAGPAPKPVVKPKPKPKPTPKPPVVVKPKPPAKPNPITKKAYVKVKGGQSLGTIAKANHTTWQQLVKWNAKAYPSLKKRPDFIQIGWKLRVK